MFRLFRCGAFSVLSKRTFVFYQPSFSWRRCSRNLSCFQHSIQSNKKSWQTTVLSALKCGEECVMNLWCCKFGCIEPRPRSWSVIQFLMYGCSSVSAAVPLKPVLIQCEHHSIPCLTLWNPLLGASKGGKAHTDPLLSSRTRAPRGLLQLICSLIGGF